MSTLAARRIVERLLPENPPAPAVRTHHQFARTRTINDFCMWSSGQNSANPLRLLPALAWQHIVGSVRTDTRSRRPPVDESQRRKNITDNSLCPRMRRASTVSGRCDEVSDGLPLRCCSSHFRCMSVCASNNSGVGSVLAASMFPSTAVASNKWPEKG